MPAGASEMRRLASVSSVAAVLTQYLGVITPLGFRYRPAWLRELGTPAGWQIAQLADRTYEPARIAVTGQHPDGSWDGCETISAFGFTGFPPKHAVHDNADRTLRDLGATEITIQRVDESFLGGAVAVRSSGYFAAAGLWMWAQYSTYVLGSSEPSQGRLIEHTVFIDSGCQARLSDDVARLTQAVHQALAAVAARN
jgi:hypothetical protein